MKMKFYYHISKNGELWGEFCSIVDGEKYNIGYSIYLGRLLFIISDKGILNLSIIMNKPKENFSINEGYELMTDFIKAVFPEGANKIEAIEITNSYCPGDYDLSINEKKFAGIAQRKIKDSVVVSIYISIFGDQQKRANIMREFYDIGIKDQQINYKYPSMAIQK